MVQLCVPCGHFIAHNPEAPPVDAAAVAMLAEPLLPQAVLQGSDGRVVLRSFRLLRELAAALVVTRVRPLRAPGGPAKRVRPMQQHFRGEVLRRAAEGVRPLVVCDLLLGEAEVRQPNVAVDHAAAVEMLQREDDLRRVELDHAFREVAHPLQVEEDVTALVVVRHEIHLVAALEGEAELRDEGMRHLRHDVSLGQGVLDLVSPGDLRLPENLHCVHDFIVGPDGSHEEDATEGPPPDDLRRRKDLPKRRREGREAHEAAQPVVPTQALAAP
eukprot:scaffold1596_cov302-Pinguiococcus_pyrenoidosus.AAC.82